MLIVVMSILSEAHVSKTPSTRSQILSKMETFIFGIS